MNTETDTIHDLLAHMGIPAEVRLDSQQERLIIIETEQFNLRRGWIESWFTLVDQNERYCYFRERLRGTGQTI